MTDSLFPELTNHDAFLTTLKQRVRTAQMRAALAVNQELVLLYWQIGREILQRQQDEGWGTKVIARLAKDLKRGLSELIILPTYVSRSSGDPLTRKTFTHSLSDNRNTRSFLPVFTVASNSLFQVKLLPAFL